MTTDNRTNEPNKYAGFIARQEHQRDPWRGIGVKCVCGKVFDLDADHAMHQVEAILEAALVAAQGAAPQAEKDIHEPSHDRVYCVRCGGNWPCQPAPVLPSSTVDRIDISNLPAPVLQVDEDALADVLLQERRTWEEHGSGSSLDLARAVAEWLKEQGR